MLTPWIKCPDRQATDTWTPERAEVGAALLSAVLAEFPAGTSTIARAVNLRTRSRFRAELEKVAGHVGRPWHQIMLANISYDLAMHTIGCSTAALAGPSGPVLVRNLDWWPEPELVAAAEAVWDEGSFRATWPGFSGVVTGMSRRGFAVAINAVGCSEKPGFLGWPVLLFLRVVLDEARDFQDAVDRLTRQRLIAPVLFTVVGRENDERVVIERTPRRARLRRPEGSKPLIATNDYRVMESNGVEDHHIDLYTTACGRFQRLSRRAEALTPAQIEDPEALLPILYDAGVFQTITVQNVIACPATGYAGAWVPRRWTETW